MSGKALRTDNFNESKPVTTQLSLAPDDAASKAPRNTRDIPAHVPLLKDVLYYNQPSYGTPPTIEIVDNSTVVIDGEQQEFTTAERAIFNALAANRASSIVSQHVQDEGFPESSSRQATHSRVSSEITKFRETYSVNGIPLLATTGVRGGGRHHMDKDILIIDRRGPLPVRQKAAPVRVLERNRPAPDMRIHKARFGLGQSALAGTYSVPMEKSRSLATKLSHLEDWQTIQAARQSPEAFDALARDFHPFIRFKASPFFLTGGETQDLVQEGLFGFYKAVKDYKPDKDSSFRNFAELCITRQIITAVKTATRGKHTPLNEAVSLNSTPQTIKTESWDQNATLEEVIASPSVSPDEAVIATEGLHFLVETLSTQLSPLESQVLSLHLDGIPYENAGDILGVSKKVVDNALQRMTRKVRAALATRG